MSTQADVERRKAERMYENRGLVVDLAKAYTLRERRGLEFLELVDAGYAALVVAVDAFDEAGSEDFTSFATPRIRAGIEDRIHRTTADGRSPGPTSDEDRAHARMHAWMLLLGYTPGARDAASPEVRVTYATAGAPRSTMEMDAVVRRFAGRVESSSGYWALDDQRELFFTCDSPDEKAALAERLRKELDPMVYAVS